MGKPAVWFYVPNLIGYVRIITGLAAFWYAFPGPAHDTLNWQAFFWLYGVSYMLDAVDGVAARKLGQLSKFGAVLDMVTDRFCTAGLLAILSKLYPAQFGVYITLMILDIVSHWAQMYSSLASGSASHKNMKDEHPLLRFYYTFPYALFFVCLFNEACLVMQVLRSSGVYAQVVAATPGLVLDFSAVPGASWVFHASATGMHAADLVYYITLPVFLLKQVFSLLQLGKAASRIVALDDVKTA